MISRDNTDITLPLFKEKGEYRFAGRGFSYVFSRKTVGIS